MPKQSNSKRMDEGLVHEAAPSPAAQIYNPITGQYVDEVPGHRTLFFFDSKTGAGLDDLLAHFRRNAPQWALVAGARAAYGLTPEGYPNASTSSADGQEPQVA